MAIEVTSVPERRWTISPKKTAKDLKGLFYGSASQKQCFLSRVIAGLVIIACIYVADSLLQSYRYYSRIIDARLASGYLTSRPGLYAAPRSLRVGQGFSRDELELVLRRAGYVETNASDVWSGSFSENATAIDIRPNRASRQSQPQFVSVGFDKGRISELTADGITLDSFTLEPEILTTDLSSKSGKRSALAYADIPPVLIQAIISIEDRRFFDHSGLDVFGVIRALLRNAGDDRIGQGGSTITQQLVKNTYLSPERTFRRKYAEAMLAFALERRLSKEDILALYCNEVYLGQRGTFAVRGVEQAAQIYFKKHLKDLSLSEAATIAGMIQGPSRYSPDRHAAALEARRNTVLAAMTRDGWINSAQAGAAARKPVEVAPSEAADTSLAPYFIDYVSRVAESQLEVSGENQRIYTTIDLDLQRIAEVAIKRQLGKLDTIYKARGKTPQAALVALDPQSGNVLAMVGGRNYGKSQLNRVTDAHRQPGSSFKPFVYAAALEDGLSPVQMFSDAPRDFTYDQNKTYHPTNFGGGYSMGDVTMRTGLVKSLNTVTVAVAMQTGLARIANLAERFGLPKPERYPSLALGTTEVTPLQLAAAYAAFVNGGKRVEPKVVAGVAEPPASHTLNNDGNGSQVISPTTAYMITNMLEAVIDHGTARNARGAVMGTAIAGKTGTSRDGWFVGYTPNLVCVVWIGFDDNDQLGLTGAEAALPTWVEFMKSAIELRPELGGRTFECPEGIKFVEIDNDTGFLSTLTCPNRELIAVTNRLAPNAECYKHGNLPERNRMPETETQPASAAILMAQQRRPQVKENLAGMNLRPLKSTRIDVDVHGRRTLVSDMR